MSDLTHVRVNVSPTAERVLSHRQAAAFDAAARRRERSQDEASTDEADGREEA